MNRVSASEFDLLSIARAAVGAAPFEEVELQLRTARRPPEALRPTAMRLLRETLGKGVVLALMRRGGAAARVWRRHEPLPLRFGKSSVRLLQWMSAIPMSAAKIPRLDLDELLLGDELLLYFACALVSGSDCEQALLSQPV